MDACVNFACKRQNFADARGGGSKLKKIQRTSFVNGPKVIRLQTFIAEIYFDIMNKKYIGTKYHWTVNVASR